MQFLTKLASTIVCLILSTCVLAATIPSNYIVVTVNATLIGSYGDTKPDFTVKIPNGEPDRLTFVTDGTHKFFKYDLINPVEEPKIFFSGEMTNPFSKLHCDNVGLEFSIKKQGTTAVILPEEQHASSSCNLYGVKTPAGTLYLDAKVAPDSARGADYFIINVTSKFDEK